jgi:exonuclease VII small subunit
MIDARERRIPTTYERAATELIRCRTHLAAARESLELAVSILRHLNGDAGIAPSSARDLESVIGDLEQAEAALRSAMP